MNKFNNPRLTNTTVSGTGVKHPMRPHVILGDPENGFIRGDLLDANAVIKLIKNAAKAIGALEELEQSNWIDDDAKTEEPTEETIGTLANGQFGFYIDDNNNKNVIKNVDGAKGFVYYRDDSGAHILNIINSKAFGMTIGKAFNDGYLEMGDKVRTKSTDVNYSDCLNETLLYAIV